MKYIRTWYGKLFGVAGLSKTGKSVFYISKKSGKQCQMPRNSGDRIADTIEELCDEFVTEEFDKISGISHGRNIDYCLEEALKNQCAKHKCYYKVYGAIWTNNGLIYVAKLNEEGEFELL